MPYETISTRDTTQPGARSRMRRAPKMPWTFLPLAIVCAILSAPSMAPAVVPPGIDANDPMVRIGYLPVTLFGAIPDDGNDDTPAIQRAINAARDYGYVTFFPSGTYHINDTLYAMQRVTKQADGSYKQDRREANVLVGSTKGARPVLKLKNGRGFDNPSMPKPLVWIWAQPRDKNAGSTNPNDEQPSISFNQVFKGIDIDLRGAGNAGAIGLRHAGSQGSALEDVTVYAKGAYAGFYNVPGQGGGSYNIAVYGGQYGIIANSSTRFPIIAGATYIEQSEAALRWDGNQNLTLAGFRIETSSSKPVLSLNPRTYGIARALTLVGGSIKTGGRLAIDNADGRNLYMKGVYISGADQIVRSGALAPVPAADTGWTKVHEYSYTGQNGQSLVNGNYKGEGDELFSLGAAVASPPADLVSRHVWTSQFPSVEDIDAVNIIKDYGARGDGVTDDTAAIKQALAENDKVFLPMGRYLVSDTITLGPNNHLFGVAKNLSIIQANRHWSAAPNTPIITTVDQASAKTTLSFLLIESHINVPELSFVDWQAGRGSIVRDIMIGVDGWSSNAPDADHKAFVVRGNGGGRWYSVAGEWTNLQNATDDPRYRHFLVDGTTEPLSVYGLNVERSHVDPQAEIRNAKNVQIYYLKGETLDTSNGVMKITGSDNVMVFGYSGNATPIGNELIEVVDSENVAVTTVSHLDPRATFDAVREVRGTPPKTLAVNGLNLVGVLKRGIPRLVTHE